MGIERVAGIVTPARAGELLVGGGAVLDSVIEVARGARETLALDFFKLEGDELLRVGRAIDDSIEGWIMVSDHPQAIAAAQDVARLSGARFNIGVYGRDFTEAGGIFNHGKVASNRDVAVFTTAPWRSEARGYHDFALRVEGAPAAIAHDLTMNAVRDDHDAVRHTYELASEHGILATDRLAGVSTLAPWIDGSAAGAGAGDSLWLATKQLQDVQLADELAGAAARGADVRIIAGGAKPKAAQRLADSSAQLTIGPALQTTPLHGNLYIINDSTYAGSGFLGRRPLDRARPGEEISREIGIVVSDSALADRARHVFSDIKFNP